MKRFCQFLPVFLVLVWSSHISATKPERDPPPDPEHVVVSGDDYEGIIIHHHLPEAEQFQLALVGEDVKGFTPAPFVVQEMEDRLEIYLKDAAKERSPELYRKVPTYKRQYIGVVQHKNEFFVVVNAFCRVPDEWKTQPVVVDDGGDCYFTVWYNVVERTFFNLQINGES